MYLKNIFKVLIFFIVFYVGEVSCYSGDAFQNLCRNLVDKGEEEYDHPENPVKTLTCYGSFASAIDGLILGIYLGIFTEARAFGLTQTQIKKIRENNPDPFKLFGICFPGGFKSQNNEEATRVTIRQIRIVNKYLVDHPEDSEMDISLIYIKAMQQTYPCKQEENIQKQAQ